MTKFPTFEIPFQTTVLAKWGSVGGGGIGGGGGCWVLMRAMGSDGERILV